MLVTSQKFGEMFLFGLVHCIFGLVHVKFILSLDINFSPKNIEFIAIAMSLFIIPYLEQIRTIPTKVQLFQK